MARALLTQTGWAIVLTYIKRGSQSLFSLAMFLWNAENTSYFLEAIKLKQVSFYSLDLVEFTTSEVGDYAIC